LLESRLLEVGYYAAVGIKCFKVETNKKEGVFFVSWNIRYGSSNGALGFHLPIYVGIEPPSCFHHNSISGQ